MNTDEIEKAICQDPSAEAIFAGVYACDQLPESIKYPAAMVWNTEFCFFCTCLIPFNNNTIHI